MKRFKHVALILIIMALSLIAVSCKPTLTANTDVIVMKIGEYVDINDYLSEEVEAVSVSDTKLVSVISGTVVRAEATGRLTVTAAKGLQSATIDIVIDYADTELSISCSSPLYTTIRESVMTFTADLGAHSDQNTEIYWYVDGNLNGTGKNYTLRLSEYKNYSVSAKANGVEASLTAVCYEPFTTNPTIKSDCGEVVKPPYSAIKFTTECESSEPAVIWYVDGQKTAESSELSFTPNSVGRHTVYALVNGIKTNEISFVAAGEAKPTNVTLDFDSDYPNVYLRWDGIPELTYDIKIGDSPVMSINPIRGNSFNLTGLIDLKRANSLSIRCMGGEYYTKSDYVTITTSALSDEALSYLNKKYFDGNYYLSSDQEVFDLISYAIVFRPDAVDASNVSSGATKSTLCAYMGYDSDMSAALLLSRGWALTEQTGSYRMKASGSARKGEKVEFEITFLTGIEPEADNSVKPTIESLITPHFASGLSDFAIDDMRSGGSVTNSEQLFYVVQKGYKPEPVEGSAAERIYAKARYVLQNTVSDDMTEAEKVQAIYDWIMWQTVYNQSVLSESVFTAVKRPAYYLEGVFDEGYAVCDGISKSMSLMCNMIGIPCVRVVGSVDEGDKVSAHAWNSVCVDGIWYNVDATWGDAKITIGNTVYESASHSYFLKAEWEMPTHKPTYPFLYPKADTYYDWYGREREYGQDKSSFYMQEVTDDLRAAINCAAQDLTFTVQIGDSVTERNFYCIELRLSSAVRVYYRLNNNVINNAILTSEISGYNVTWVIANEILFIIIDR